MENPYKRHLDKFYQKSNYFSHISFRFENLINKEYQSYISSKSEFYSSNSLIIADWTGETENGWDISFHTGIFTITDQVNYEVEMLKMKSRHNLLNFAQNLEAFQGFLKDIIIEKNKSIKRKDLSKNHDILLALKREGGKCFIDFSSSNNRNFKYDILFNMLVELRHSITHSNGIVEKNKIIKDNYSYKLFDVLFPDSIIGKEEIKLVLPYRTFSTMMKMLNEFAFQIYKIFSVECKFTYQLN